MTLFGLNSRASAKSINRDLRQKTLVPEIIQLDVETREFGVSLHRAY
jgi:hypothetical protein